MLSKNVSEKLVQCFHLSEESKTWARFLEYGNIIFSIWYWLLVINSTQRLRRATELLQQDGGLAQVLNAWDATSEFELPTKLFSSDDVWDKKSFFLIP